MTPELTYLAYSVVLLFAIIMTHAASGLLNNGLVVMANSRDNLPPPTTFNARAKRLVDNSRENTLIFAALVLIAAVAPVSNQWTILGAQIFFFARIGHAIVYLAGLPLIRPLFWAAGVAGCAMILLALFGVLS